MGSTPPLRPSMHAQEVYADLDARPPPSSAPGSADNGSSSHSQSSEPLHAAAQQNGSAGGGSGGTGAPTDSTSSLSASGSAESRHSGGDGGGGGSGGGGSAGEAGATQASELSVRGGSTSTSMRRLLSDAGWSDSDMLVSVYYVGVDYEYRRWVGLAGRPGSLLNMRPEDTHQ